MSICKQHEDEKNFAQIDDKMHKRYKFCVKIPAYKRFQGTGMDGNWEEEKKEVYEKGCIA